MKETALAGTVNNHIIDIPHNSIQFECKVTKYCRSKHSLHHTHGFSRIQCLQWKPLFSNNPFWITNSHSSELLPTKGPTSCSEADILQSSCLCRLHTIKYDGFNKVRKTQQQMMLTDGYWPPLWDHGLRHHAFPHHMTHLCTSSYVSGGFCSRHQIDMWPSQKYWDKRYWIREKLNLLTKKYTSNHF